MPGSAHILDKDTSTALEQPIVAVAVRGPVLPFVLPFEAAVVVAHSSHPQPGTIVPTPPNWPPGSAVVVPVAGPVLVAAACKMVEECMMQPLLVEEAAGLKHMVLQVVMGLKTVLANPRCYCLYRH